MYTTYQRNILKEVHPTSTIRLMLEQYEKEADGNPNSKARKSRRCRRVMKTKAEAKTAPPKKESQLASSKAATTPPKAVTKAPAALPTTAKVAQRSDSLC